MKIALFSDIHANLPALESCFKAIDAEKPDAIYCLGDLVGYNCWPNEVIHEIRKRGIPCIAGNYDQGVGLNSDDCGCAYKTDSEKELGNQSISFTNEIIGTDERNYLKCLPAHIRLEFKMNEHPLQLLFVHGSPRKINEYLFEDRDEQSFLRIMQQSNADILCFGHTHKPFHRIFKETDSSITRYRHAINIGSVGKPKDGDPRGCFVLIELSELTDIHHPDSLSVSFIRFEYDIEKSASAIEDSILPTAFADMLRSGG